MKRTFLTFLFSGLFWACATSPTGRRQLILLPDAQMDEMGAQAFSQMQTEIPVETDQSLTGYVKCVVSPITKRVKSTDYNWEVVVFKSDDVNAFALPGGKIGVYTGLLKVATTPDQLAAVLGHEVGHVIARHGAERMSQSLLIDLGMSAADITLKNGTAKPYIMGALGLGAQFGVQLPHSRGHESESDKIGQDLMAKAGFDPSAAIKLWQNMAKASGGAPPEFMSTHPSHQTRINALKQNLSAAKKYYASATSKPSCVAP